MSAIPAGSRIEPPDLERPPAPDEGEIGHVDLQSYNGLAAPRHIQPCQYCGEAVPVAEPHVLAVVRIYRQGLSSKFVRPRFCDRACWAAWAGSRE